MIAAPIPNTLLYTGLCLVIVLALIAAVAPRRGGYSYKAQRIMTGNELEFFRRLVRAVPGGFVFPQVAMSALIAPTATNQKTRLAAFRRIAQKRVDYAIYTEDMELLCVVELDDRTHNARKDAARDGILETAGVNTIRWHSKRKPGEAEIRAQFARLLQAKGQAPTGFDDSLLHWESTGSHAHAAADRTQRRA